MGCLKVTLPFFFYRCHMLAPFSLSLLFRKCVRFWARGSTRDKSFQLFSGSLCCVVLNAADLTTLNTFPAGAGHTGLQATTREHKHMLAETREDRKAPEEWPGQGQSVALQSVCGWSRTCPTDEQTSNRRRTPTSRPEALTAPTLTARNQSYLSLGPQLINQLKAYTSPQQCDQSIRPTWRAASESQALDRSSPVPRSSWSSLHDLSVRRGGTMISAPADNDGPVPMLCFGFFSRHEHVGAARLKKEREASLRWWA